MLRNLNEDSVTYDCDEIFISERKYDIYGDISKRVDRTVNFYLYECV